MQSHLFFSLPRRSPNPDSSGSGLNVHKDTIVEISSFYGAKKPEGIRIRLENHFPQLETTKTHFDFLSDETDTKIEQDENV